MAIWRPYVEQQDAGVRGKDERIRGPSDTIFPQNYGWMIDGEPIELNTLTIKTITYYFTQRKFKPYSAGWQCQPAPDSARAARRAVGSGGPSVAQTGTTAMAAPTGTVPVSPSSRAARFSC